MRKHTMSDKVSPFVDAMANMREEEALRLAQQMLEDGEDPLVVLQSCREAMGIVGKHFEEGEYFLPELVLAGEMLKTISVMAKDRMAPGSDVERAGRVIVGTVKGDIHDIGKDIVVHMLDANGFEVLDLGIDVPPEVFVERIRDFQPQVVGLSGFLTLAFDSMKSTVEAVRDAGLRNTLKIMIGGGQMDDRVRAYCGADAYGADAVAAVSLARDWIRTDD
jgi:5-methyltetrahydrofolate--homocysteine methyltransferase